MNKSFFFINPELKSEYESSLHGLCAKLDNSFTETLAEIKFKLVARYSYYQIKDGLFKLAYERTGYIIACENCLLLFEGAEIKISQLCLILNTNLSYFKYQSLKISDKQTKKSYYQNTVIITNLLGDVRISTTIEEWDKYFHHLQKNFIIYHEENHDFIPKKVIEITPESILCEVELKKNHMVHLAKKFRKDYLLSSSLTIHEFMRELMSTNQIFNTQVPRIAHIYETMSDVIFIYDLRCLPSSKNGFLLATKINFTLVESINIIYSIIQCLTELSSENIYHHNINLFSVIICQINGKQNINDIKLIGFKNYREEDFNDKSNIFDLNKKQSGFVAPEIVFQQLPIDIRKVDSFSIGSFFYFLLGLNPPISQFICDSMQIGVSWKYKKGLLEILSDKEKCIAGFFKFFLKQSSKRFSVPELLSLVKSTFGPILVYGSKSELIDEGFHGLPQETKKKNFIFEVHEKSEYLIKSKTVPTKFRGFDDSCHNSNMRKMTSIDNLGVLEAKSITDTEKLIEILKFNSSYENLKSSSSDLIESPEHTLYDHLLIHYSNNNKAFASKSNF